MRLGRLCLPIGAYQSLLPTIPQREMGIIFLDNHIAENGSQVLEKDITKL